MQGYYRIHTPLAYHGIILRANSIHWLRLKPENLAVLVELGNISPVKTPPLSEIPEWEKFIDRLSEIGVITVQDFLETPNENLTFIWRNVEHIAKRKNDLIEQYLMVQVTDKDCNC
jgi:hypothetical protein